MTVGRDCSNKQQPYDFSLYDFQPAETTESGKRLKVACLPTVHHRAWWWTGAGTWRVWTSGYLSDGDTPDRRRAQAQQCVTLDLLAGSARTRNCRDFSPFWLSPCWDQTKAEKRHWQLLCRPFIRTLVDGSRDAFPEKGRWDQCSPLRAQPTASALTVLTGALLRKWAGAMNA